MTTSKSQAIQDLQWAIGINRLSLKIFGADTAVDGDSGWRSTVAKLRVLLFFLLLLVVVLAPQTAALVRVWGHLLLMIDNLVAYILLAVIEFEFITLWRKNDAIMTMMDYMRCDWMREKTQQEREVMLRYGKLSRIVTIGGYLIIIVALIFYHSPVIFGVVLRTVTNLTDIGDRPFVIPAFFPFDAYVSPVYEFIVISQFVIGTISGFCYTTVSALFGAIVLHVSAQLEILYNRIEEMGKNDDTDNFQIQFKCNIEEHARLIRFFDMIEGTFSLVLLAIITGFTLMICLQVYQMIVILGDDVQRPLIQVIFGINYVIYIMFTTFVYSAVGDVLATQSNKIQYATYNCDWYKLKPREAAQLIPVLVRSQKPLLITAGKFVNITLSSFATLLKTTAGYISCLLAVRD